MIRYGVVLLLSAAFCALSTGCGDNKSPVAPAIPVSLSGRVLEGERGLSDVYVYIAGTILDSLLTTSSDGAFHLDEIPPGKYSILPVRSGYRFDPPSMEIELGETGIELQIFTAKQETPRSPETVEGFTLLPIPSGSFLMGSGNGQENEWPVHRVALPSFYMSATEINQDIYKKVIQINPSYWGEDLRMPVDQVSWEEALHFCNLLSDLDGRDRCYTESTWECDFTRNGYRLPTEAEWEYACRAGTVTEYNTGDTETNLGQAGWYVGNGSGASKPVGAKKPNAWGLYDMHGNLWEWCSDRYLDMYYSISPGYNPKGPMTGSLRVIRGGSWFSNPFECRSSFRGFTTPDNRYFRIGFRVVRND